MACRLWRYTILWTNIASLPIKHLVTNAKFESKYNSGMKMHLNVENVSVF